MFKCLAAFLLALTLVPAARAQVTAEVLVDRDHFIPGESVVVAVRIVNHSGQSLHFGDQPGWLTFAVEGREGEMPKRNGQVPVDAKFTLDSSKMATLTVELTPYFDMSTPGRYAITATVQIPGWNEKVVSNEKSIQISGGTKFWEKVFGVPPTDGAKQGAPEVRTYSLVKSSQMTGVTLYARVADASGTHLLKVTPLGSLISFSDPEARLDRFSNLHVFWQNGPRTYQYTVVNPDGQLFQRQTYYFEGSRPKMSAQEDGRIRVIGGERVTASNDIPPRE